MARQENGEGNDCVHIATEATCFAVGTVVVAVPVGAGEADGVGVPDDITKVVEFSPSPYLQFL